MGRQSNKIEKRRRQISYLKRKKERERLAKVTRKA
jgi:hypothetical protein